MLRTDSSIIQKFLSVNLKEIKEYISGLDAKVVNYYIYLVELELVKLQRSTTIDLEPRERYAHPNFNPFFSGKLAFDPNTLRLQKTLACLKQRFSELDLAWK